ncbi:LysR family transcriptional regulator [Photobacterium makurazakiensis]|uniref:LysR family transcriptional regulator n=1 Tax=Photobacterium makurazakiensis TaxID=2910234 RepID=UPI003D0E574A
MQNQIGYSIGKSNNVDIRLLSVFIAVVEHGGFTQAQVSLNIALSSISTYIQDLETRLGMKLCNRGRAGFSLTQSGQMVYEEACHLFSALEKFNNNVAHAGGTLTGELRVGVLDNSTMSPSTRVPEVIHQFSTLYPDVHICIKVMSNDEIEKELMDGSIHLGIGAFSELKSSLRVLVHFPVTIDLYCGQKSILYTKQSVLVDDLTLTNYAQGCYSPDTKSKLVQKLPSPTAFSYLSEGLAFMIMSGRYVGYLPRRYAENWVNLGEMKALSESSFSYDLQLALAMQKGEKMSVIMEAFLRSFESFSKK